MRSLQRLILGQLIIAFVLCLTSRGFGQEEKIKLVYWRIWEDFEVFESVINAYERQHPNVEIEYIKYPLQHIKTNLKPSLEAGIGPDMFEIHASWLPYFKSELAPIPETVFSREEYSSTFHDFVARAFSSNNQFWAVALGANTLALFYNKDIFIEAGLNPDIPPRSWDELVEYAVNIRERTGKWGAALGTAFNTPQDHNVLEMFAVQNGAKPVSEDLRTSLVNSAQFVEAMQFYTDFVLKYQVWSPSSQSGDAAFTSGEVGMIINGSWVINAVLNSDINAGTANVPQQNPTRPYTHATFWGEVVSANCPHPEVAWDFIKFCASKENMKSFFQKTKRPPSRRDLISITTDDPEVRNLIQPFINQAVYAGQWFKPWEDDWKSAQIAAIEGVIRGGQIPQAALDIAAEKETIDLRDYLQKSEYKVTGSFERKKIAAGPGEELYSVLPGDNLFKVAEIFYGDQNEWQKIYDRNQDRIIHRNYIYNGQVLIIPKN